MNELFPVTEDEIVEELPEEELPLAQDWAVDFETDALKTVGGRNYYVYGMDAVAVWIYKALRTMAGEYVIYDDFGAEDLRGIRDDGLIEEIIRDALGKSPYIIDVTACEVERSGDVLRIVITVSTIYGAVETEDELNVEL